MIDSREQQKIQIPHICVCICTYKRPRLLGNLLGQLNIQETRGLFDYSIVVVDNDRTYSGRKTVEARARHTQIKIRYCIEPLQNIALARNKAIEVSEGDFVAFIDDDEFPDSRWLLNLYLTAVQHKTAGVLGPVLPFFETEPPKWVLRGRLFNRPIHSSGQVLRWKNTRTGNVLLRRSLFEEGAVWFHPKFGSGGEDLDFFRRQIELGHVFVWCNEAPVFEIVPPERWRAKNLIQRALLRGKMALYASEYDPISIYISLVAILLYGLSLPYLLLLSPYIGFEFFMKYLIKSCDHLGRIFALFQIDLVKNIYVTT